MNRQRMGEQSGSGGSRLTQGRRNSVQYNGCLFLRKSIPFTEEVAGETFGPACPSRLRCMLRDVVHRARGFGVALAAPIRLPAFSVILDLLAGMKRALAAALAEEKGTGVVHSITLTIEGLARSSFPVRRSHSRTIPLRSLRLSDSGQAVQRTIL